MKFDAHRQTFFNRLVLQFLEFKCLLSPVCQNKTRVAVCQVTTQDEKAWHWLPPGYVCIEDVCKGRDFSCLFRNKG